MGKDIERGNDQSPRPKVKGRFPTIGLRPRTRSFMIPNKPPLTKRSKFFYECFCFPHSSGWFHVDRTPRCHRDYRDPGRHADSSIGWSEDAGESCQLHEQSSPAWHWRKYLRGWFRRE